MIGTLINAGSVLVGGAIGMLLKKKHARTDYYDLFSGNWFVHNSHWY